MSAVNSNAPEWYLGIMSGTSLDGIDLSAVQFTNENITQTINYFVPFPPELKKKLLTLATCTSLDPIIFGETDIELGKCYANAIVQFSETSAFKGHLSLQDINAIGNHGQTIRHHPTSSHPFTWQIGDPNYICLQTQIPVCYDFRRMDMAAGGQGAPLAPLFHEYLFKSATVSGSESSPAAKNSHIIVLNLGGIANISVLTPNLFIACDTGPANTLIDRWTQLNNQGDYDEDGQWGQQGQVHQTLLRELLKHSYFNRPLPKSTGPEDFHLDWVQATLQQVRDTISAVDVQTTLYALTVDSIALHLEKLIIDKTLDPQATKLIIAGGGSQNSYLCKLLQQRFDFFSEISTSQDYHIDPLFLESAAFAWLARQRFHRLPLNTAPYTGAKQPVILGAMITPSN